MTQLPDNTTNNLPEPTEPTKQDKFISYLFTEQTIKDAARKAGYAESTCASVTYTMLKDPKFQDKLRQYAINNDLLSLPVIAKIENKCLNLVDANPEKYPKFKEIFRQKKQVAGILAQDTTPAVPTINIKSIEHLQVVLGDQVHRRVLTLDKPVKAISTHPTMESHNQDQDDDI